MMDFCDVYGAVPGLLKSWIWVLSFLRKCPASFLEKVASMMDQEYRGDINISYPIEWKTFTHLLANPNRDEFYDYINKGQMATWPKIAFIKDQVRLNKILEINIAK